MRNANRNTNYHNTNYHSNRYTARHKMESHKADLSKVDNRSQIEQEVLREIGEEPAIAPAPGLKPGKTLDKKPGKRHDKYHRESKKRRSVFAPPGRSFLLSYEKPVAYSDQLTGQVYRTNAEVSYTTFRHIREWVSNNFGPDYPTVATDPDVIEREYERSQDT